MRLPALEQQASDAARCGKRFCLQRVTECKVSASPSQSIANRLYRAPLQHCRSVGIAKRPWRFTANNYKKKININKQLIYKNIHRLDAIPAPGTLFSGCPPGSIPR